ncbi:MAG: ATP-binding cassette domain-containing protein [Spirochaetota bacterium]
MITIENLSISFENRIIINNINMNIDSGKTLVVFGKNGSGKSVLLKAIAGLIRDYSGSIKINETDIKNFYDDSGSFNSEHSSMAYVFQKGGLFDSMDVFENVAFPLRRKRIKEDMIAQAVNNALNRVGLSGNEKKFPSELSGGMQKRVGLARAICVNPDIILYDDPTAGLDPILSDSISDIISEIKNSNKCTSLVVTHDIKVAQKVADEIALIYKGELAFTGSNNDFFSGNNTFARQFIEAKLDGPIDIY